MDACLARVIERVREKSHDVPIGKRVEDVFAAPASPASLKSLVARAKASSETLLRAGRGACSQGAQTTLDALGVLSEPAVGSPSIGASRDLRHAPLAHAAIRRPAVTRLTEAS
jgi:hypothetical protein